MRRLTISQILFEELKEFYRTHRDGEPVDPSDPDMADGLRERFERISDFLGEQGLRQWHNDQKTIERYHRCRYGHIDKFIQCHSFGATPEAMYLHIVGKFCEKIQAMLSDEEQRKFREEIRDELANASIEPLALHAASGKAKDNFYDPELVPGSRDYALRFLYPCEEISD